MKELHQSITLDMLASAKHSTMSNVSLGELDWLLTSEDASKAVKYVKWTKHQIRSQLDCYNPLKLHTILEIM